MFKELINRRQEEIKKKGFNMAPSRDEDIQSPLGDIDFTKIKVGLKFLKDATLSLGDLKKTNSKIVSKDYVIQAIQSARLPELREISNLFFHISGIYARLCRYLAYLYKYDWLVTPYVAEEKIKNEKVINKFYQVLDYLDDFGVKKYFGEIALKVIKNGCYYGYIVAEGKKISIQELPVNFCRSRFKVGHTYAVEFNMKQFDEAFTDTEQRLKILNLFPAEFKKGYALYKQGKLLPEFPGDSAGWQLLDINSAVKFNINEDDFPFLIAMIPALIDLDEAKELDRKRMQQRLLKIIIQKLPMDKNGELVFDIDEAKELHNNAVHMLNKTIGTDVLTTFADVDVADLSDDSNNSTIDDLERIERTVFNESGVAENLFNTDGNLALEKSILNDEASMYNLVLQFENFLNSLVVPFNNGNKFFFRVQILNTTIYNYKEMAKLYKEQTQLGYSKMLPQIALGQSQRSILATAFFENDILDLVNVFIPPLMSSTMNAEALSQVTNKNSNPLNGNSSGEVGRKEKPDDEKSEKTIANKESES